MMKTIDQLRKDRLLLLNTVKTCAVHFRNEEIKFLARGELEKARTNAILAVMCEQSIEQANTCALGETKTSIPIPGKQGVGIRSE